MARYPGAAWRGPIPLSNFSTSPLGVIKGVTIHHMDGSLASTDNVFRKPGYGRSAHFGTGRDGTVYQWVDTSHVAYHACNANWTGYIGIENDDEGADLPLTDTQITAIRGIIDWLGIDKKLMTSMSDTGVGYHGQFPGPCATHWGQTACPGSMIDQLPLLIAAPAPQEAAAMAAISVPNPANPARIDQFYVDTNGHLIQKYYPGSGPSWSTFDLMGGCIPNDTPNGKWTDDGSRVDVFVRAVNGLGHYWYDGTPHSEVI